MKFLCHILIINIQLFMFKGVSDRREEGTFVWESDETRLGYAHWRKGEPNNRGNEDCVHLRYADKLWKGSWNDLRCTRDKMGNNRPLTALCER